MTSKIADHKKITEQLENERDELVKKMDQYFTALKGTSCENILETTTKLKKSITKVEPGEKIDDDDSDEDSSDSDDSDEDTDDEATPAEPLKKFNAKNKKDDSDSDDSE